MLTAADIEGACKLLNNYLTKYKLVTEFNEDEFAHWFLPRKNIIDTFVVENDGQVTDMVSFYTLPSTVMSHPAYDSIKAAYSFYNVAGSVSWVDLMENVDFLEKLKFGIGDGNLQ